MQFSLRKLTLRHVLRSVRSGEGRRIEISLWGDFLERRRSFFHHLVPRLAQQRLTLLSPKEVWLSWILFTRVRTSCLVSRPFSSNSSTKAFKVTMLEKANSSTLTVIRLFCSAIFPLPIGHRCGNKNQ